MFCLALVESAVLYGSYFLGVTFRFAGDLRAADHDVGSLIPRAIFFAIVFVLAMLSVGLYRAHQQVQFVGTLLRLCTAAVFAALGSATFYYVFPSIATGRGAQALALGIALVGLSLVRVAFYAIVDSGRFRRVVLVYGHGAAAASLTHLCNSIRQSSFRIAGFVGVQGEPLREECKPLLTRTGSVLQLAREYQVDEIVVAMDNRRDFFPTRDLLDCRLVGIKVSEALSFLEREAGKIDVGVLRPSWLIYGGGFRQGTAHRVLKRLFDVASSLLLLLITLPILVIAIAAILVESKGRGGVFLHQRRVGLHGVIFPMLKLRSMIVDAESNGTARWAAAADPRVTFVGSVIRRFRIDELPQIINILKGEMSFVGPRPERPTFVATLIQEIPFYAERHSVKPGLTGWAQLCYPYGSSVEDARQKLYYDLFYVKNHSPMFDLSILLQTVDVVLWGRASHSSAAAVAPQVTVVTTAQQTIKVRSL